MPRSPLQALCVAAATVLILGGLAGCGGSGGGSTTGTGTIRVSLVDAPANAEAVNVDISSLQVHSSGSGWVTVKDYSPALRVNLLDYRSAGNALLLADAPLQTGHYTMVRLMLSSAEVVIGGQSYAVDMSNVAQTGVKCNGQFTVAAGQLVALILDFNAGKSVVESPSGSDNYKLHPVMTMSPVNIASEVIGKVEVKDAEGNALPVAEGSTVDAYVQGHVGDAAYLVNGTAVAADGTFRIAVMAQGVYDFRVTAGTLTQDLTSVSVNPPQTDLGTIVLQPAPPAP